jgi:hypothetical protein
LHVQQTALDPGTVTRLVVDTVEAMRSLEGRLSSLPLKELAESPIQTAQHPLTGRHVQHTKRIILRFLVTPVAPHGRLLGVPDTGTRRLLSLTATVEDRMVQPTTGLENVTPGPFLCWRWIAAVFAPAQHLASLLFLDIPPDRFHRDLTDLADVIAACPQIWQTAFGPG